MEKVYLEFHTATLKSYNAQKGFGFMIIDNDKREIFFHISKVEESSRESIINSDKTAKYDYQVRENEKGYYLEKIRLLDPFYQIKFDKNDLSEFKNTHYINTVPYMTESGHVIDSKSVRVGELEPTEYSLDSFGVMTQYKKLIDADRRYYDHRIYVSMDRDIIILKSSKIMNDEEINEFKKSLVLSNGSIYRTDAGQTWSKNLHLIK